MKNCVSIFTDGDEEVKDYTVIDIIEDTTSVYYVTRQNQHRVVKHTFLHEVSQWLEAQTPQPVLNVESARDLWVPSPNCSSCGLFFY